MRRVSSVLSSANSPTSMMMMMMMMIVAAEKNYEVTEANHKPTRLQDPTYSKTDVALGVATPVLP